MQHENNELFRSNTQPRKFYLSPYQKENNQMKYLKIESNQPPTIIKQFPLSIESQILSLSSSEVIFNDSVTQYQDALDKSGYKH